MRQLAATIMILFFCITTPQAQVFHEKAGTFERHFSVKVNGGGIRWSMSDWDKYHGFFLGQKQVWIKIDGEHFKYGNDAEVELIYAFHPQLRVGVGIHRAWGQGRFDWVDSYEWEESHKDVRQEIIDTQITPIYLTLYNNGTNYPNRPYIGIGIGYYFSSFTHHSEYHLVHRPEITTPDSSNVRDGDMSASGIGYHAIIGTEYYLTRNIALLAEIKGRIVKISGYTGKVKESIDNGAAVESDAEFKYYATPQITFLGTQPKGTPIISYLNPRDGEMNYSGASFKLGISYHF